MTKSKDQLSEHVSKREAQMAEVLAKIVADKRIWLDQKKSELPLASFQSQVTPSDRSFYDALKTENAAFILECKKASPSKGVIREDFDLEFIASVYGQYASAVSVLTDEKYFKGNFDFLPVVRSQLSQPVLCKDFMVDSYQVYLARHHKADAILLMLSVLNDQEYQALAKVAHSLNMGVLTEVSNHDELSRAVALDAKVIGINNRNLRDLSTDLNRTKELAPSIRKLAPDAVVISESGIYTNQQVRDLATFADGFLIGSSLMGEDDLEGAVKKVILGENKVCGLTRTQDAAHAYQSGAIFGGLIFVQGSPRYVTQDQAADVIKGAPLKYVGVFKDQPIDEITTLATALNLAAVQLHGNETAEYITALRTQLNTSVEIWKAYGVSNSTPDKLAAPIDRHLFDSKVGEQSGGTGQCFDWALIKDVEDVMLAGGLNPENARDAAGLKTLGLDLNSGVESAPGHKDLDKLQQAFAAIRQY